MYTSALQRCNSTTDCDNGNICCKITKVCVSKCKRKACRKDSDCSSGECCDSNNTCTDKNCNNMNVTQTVFLWVFGVAFLPICSLLYICYLCCTDKKNENTGVPTAHPRSTRADEFRGGYGIGIGGIGVGGGGGCGGSGGC